MEGSSEGEGIGSFVMALERLYEALNRLSETHPEWTAQKRQVSFLSCKRFPGSI